MLHYLRNNYSPHAEERAFFEDILQDDSQVENMILKNKVLLDGWMLTASKVFRGDKNILFNYFQENDEQAPAKQILIVFVKLVTHTF